MQACALGVSTCAAVCQLSLGVDLLQLPVQLLQLRRSLCLGVLGRLQHLTDLGIHGRKGALPADKPQHLQGAPCCACHCRYELRCTGAGEAAPGR